VIPLRDDNPTLRTPVVTIALLGMIAMAWLLVQDGGANPVVLASTICNWGLVPAELTGFAPLGTAVAIGPGMACVVDAESVNIATPLTSMFLHGGWAHVIGNCVFLWIFGDNVEDSMGRPRFVFFYLICGLSAAIVQVAVSPASAVPMVGASGAIAGVLGGYLVLYPRARIYLLVVLVFFVDVIAVPAWLVLLYWFGLQLVFGLPQLTAVDASAGIAFWAHIGGFGAGALFVRLFAKKELIQRQ
jgi:membrane associated rhomboid family serine protease